MEVPLILIKFFLKTIILFLMKISWLIAYNKLLKIQKNIKYSEKKNARLCRNLQRLLIRSRSIQLLLINEIIKITSGVCVYKQKKQLIFTTKNIHPTALKRPRAKAPRWALGHVRCPEFVVNDIQKLNITKTKYRQFLKEQIIIKLWILALLPMLDNNKSLTYQTSLQIHKTFRLYLKKPFVKYVLFCKLSNFFSEKNKYWIMSNILIEKKFLFNWLRYKNKINPLESILKKLITLHLMNSLVYPFGEESLSRNLRFLEYNDILIIFLKKKLNIKYLNNFIKFYGLNLQFYLLENLENGINFLGWRFGPRCAEAPSWPTVGTLLLPTLAPFELAHGGRLAHSGKRLPTPQCAKAALKRLPTVGALARGARSPKASAASVTSNPNTLKRHLSISNKSLYNNKKEIKKYLKISKNQPIDKVIYGLNIKISALKRHGGLTKRSKINNYLFWQIWCWLKKRHKNKNSKWLYNRYWINSNPKEWIFASNNETLVLVKRPRKRDLLTKLVDFLFLQIKLVKTQ
uniref:Group II intron maturase-specific domain-containing protein n=1 Tax=Flabellia petiolata TaxID=189428 RepID=A0A386AX31_9CHLO|nr:hypothetical protein [Flabellia petiolata]